ncbi:MAG: imidazolonepropionase [Flavobacteriia bacterium]|nr:imidazolonepropionase [Flavobacteriia bacterium]
MNKIVLLNIQELLQVRPMPTQPLRGEEFTKLPKITNAYLVLCDNEVERFGEMSELNPDVLRDSEVIDATGRLVFPAFCDSHTHAVFASPRESELVDKIKGLSYQEIAASGGGILNSAKKVQQMSEEELFLQSLEKVEQIIQGGTGALEIKSGYGLTLKDELKMLRVISRLKAHVDIPIKATFLAAHAIPAEFERDKEAFMDEVVHRWIPKVLEEGLADYVDLFCETGYFDAGDVQAVAQAIQGTPLKLKVHVNQFTAIQGIEAAVKNKAITVDHLEVLDHQDLVALKSGETIATVLPACSFYLNIPFSPVKELIKEGIPISLASDFNPGSSPSSNMFFVWSLACIKMKLTPEQALNALTVNSAFAMGLEATHGAIFKGYRGKIIVTNKVPSLAYLPYAFGTNHIHQILN